MPILPSGDYVPESSSDDTLFLDPSDNTRQNESYFHTQVSPIMAEDVFFELDDKLTSIIGDGELPQEQLHLLFSEPDGLAQSNPPLLRFGFVTPKGVFNPDDITVSMDSENISDKIRYSVYDHKGRKATYCLATYMPDMYLDSQNQHSFDISITPQKGNQLQKQINFGVENDDNLRVIHADFATDKTEKFFQLNKLMVLIQYSKSVKLGDRLLKPDRWTIEYADSGLTPVVNSINKLSDRVYAISFAEEFEISKSVNISFSPTDGVESNTFDFDVPRRPITRGGSVVRTAQSSLPDCITCQNDGQGTDYGFTDHIAHSAVECEDLHYLTVNTYCPPPSCDPGIRTGTRYTYYSFIKSYYTEPSDNGWGYVYTSPPSNVGVCGGINRVYYFAADIRVQFEMVAIDDPLQGYCLIDESQEFTLDSDTAVPEIDDNGTFFSIEERCAHPPPCTDCEKYADYILTVKATDNNCVIPNCMFLVKYNNGEIFDLTPAFDYIPPQVSEPHEFVKRYKINNPNLFACADFLKIIVHDHKGNWNSHKMDKMPPDVPVYDPKKLPYPTKVFLTYDERLPQGVSEYRQYVNLNRQLEDEIDQEVCTYKLIVDEQLDMDVNHGKLIYMKVTTYPPLPEIAIKVEYIDPLFNDSNNQSPTNKRAGQIGGSGCIAFDPDSAHVFTESHNGSMTIEGYHKLWSQHAPYAIDDYRLLGDNWNYYIEDPSQIELYDVPWCDPIRTHTPDVPCFWNCVAPPGKYCVNQNCQEGEMTQLDTNIHGKFGLYFDTKSHGGDNFQFRASNGYSPMLGLENCLVSEPPEIFTVWRKIYVDYAWMDDRNGEYTDDYPCVVKDGNDKILFEITEDNKELIEYNGYHHINYGNFGKIVGVFDDSFIEIVKQRHFEDTDYRLSLPDIYITLLLYGDGQTGWRPPPKDSVFMFGVDHLEYDCPGGASGMALHPHYLNNTDDYYNFVSVGSTYDYDNAGLAQTLDTLPTNTIEDYILMTSSHEITHSLTELMDRFFVQRFEYGIMIPTDRRSYHNEGTIVILRSSLPDFDKSNT